MTFFSLRFVLAAALPLVLLPALAAPAASPATEVDSSGEKGTPAEEAAPAEGSEALPAIPAIERRLPPRGAMIEPQRRDALIGRLELLEEQAAEWTDHPRHPDLAALLRAVRLALDLEEFYKAEDAEKADRLLDEAQRRAAALKGGDAPWTAATGRVLRGYRSSIDGSAQAYALEIPETLPQDGAPLPLFVWLHGRGDSQTDLHFLDQRMNRPGTIEVPDALVVHPFGRHCVGFKHAGEVDVLETIDHVVANYPVDPKKIVLMGFSMGGAGAWHIGAHFTDRFVAVAPGAGFAETARYQRLTPAHYPTEWEQTLWRVYDVPHYVRNLFNCRVIAYSGEEDKQIQAAQVMEQAFAAEGKKLDHRIGPGMGHKYHGETLTRMIDDLLQTARQGLDPLRPLHLQTQTLRYSKMRWVQLTALDRHYEETRVDAAVQEDQWQISTSNVAALQIDPPGPRRVVIDSVSLALPAEGLVALRRDSGGRWQLSEEAAEAEGRAKADDWRKRPGLQGPIDDAFTAPFLVVLPSSPCRHPQVDRWVQFESNHFLGRWRALFRGDARVKYDHEVSEEDLQRYHLVLWGDRAANELLRRIEAAAPPHWPLQWDEETVKMAGHLLPADSHVPAFIFPNPLNPDRYLVVNSGLTFRESHDRTNSLQNPRLPDWALIGLDRLPDAEEPGRVLDAGFFDETWR